MVLKISAKQELQVFCRIFPIVSGAAILGYGINWSLLRTTFKQSFLNAESPKVLNAIGKMARASKEKGHTISVDFLYSVTLLIGFTFQIVNEEALLEKRFHSTL